MFCSKISFSNILYYKPFFEKIKDKVEQLVNDRISPHEQMLQDEFWYVLIFHNCYLLNASC